MEYPSLKPVIILLTAKIDAWAHSDNGVWFAKKNEIFFIDSKFDISLYDDFSHVYLKNIIYLKELATLCITIEDQSKIKILFERPDLPTFIFSSLSTTPEIAFESSKKIILFIGRSIVEYVIKENKFYILKNQDTVELLWNSQKIKIEYKIKSTLCTIKENRQKLTVNGDIWKIINNRDSIYLFSNSINDPITVHKVDLNSNFEKLFSYNLTFHSMKLLKNQAINDTGNTPLLIFSPKGLSSKKSHAAIFFIHGGPHQKSGNLWDPLLSTFLDHHYSVYVSQYSGTVGVKDTSITAYGVDDFNNLLSHYKQIRLNHNRVIVVGHSYGVFLAFKLACHAPLDVLVGINGVYDLMTIAQINPKTYAHLDYEVLRARSPQNTFLMTFHGCLWHHIQFTRDFLIKPRELCASLKTVCNLSPSITYLNFSGHSIDNEVQSKKIMNIIMRLEDRFYNNRLLR